MTAATNRGIAFVAMAPWTLPWQPGTATGLGPMPGTDPMEAARVVAGELPQLPHVPELPERGVGADAIGRTAALLVDLHVDVHAGRWRVVPRPSHDERNARELLERDLDALEDAAGSHAGPVKVQVVGPWSLAASLELARGDKVLADSGAARDVVASLSEAIALHVAEVRRRLPKSSRVLVQVDETLLPAVLGGALRSASGWARLPVPEPAPAEQALAAVLEAAGGDAGVRCASAGAPLAMLRRAGARFLSFDAEELDALPEDDVGEAIEGGTGLLLGLVPAPPGTAAWDGAADAADMAAPARRLWGRLGLARGHWDGVVVTPSCDLSALDAGQAVTVLRRCREVARVLQAPEGDTHAEELTEGS